MFLRPQLKSVFVVLALNTPNAIGADAFRVCADPYNLPSSNKTGEGYENEIARLFARDLRLPLRFEWFPQRIGFIRNTLYNRNTADGGYKCDIVMGVPEKFELTATSKAYMRTSWALVYVRGRHLDEVREAEELLALPAARLRSLKIGSFDRSPANAWMAKRGLLGNLRPYQSMTGDVRAYPGLVIANDLLGGAIDALFIFGPIAGYFAGRLTDSELVVLPMKNNSGRFEYQLAMGVRHGENNWLVKINALIDKHQERINRILTGYGVPLLPLISD